uniref:CST complex subunit CTC1 n=1 Tax=Rhizophora mucronata TaxID=61149 RepID=A0A2P2JC02_RHIMU
MAKHGISRESKFTHLHSVESIEKLEQVLKPAPKEPLSSIESKASPWLDARSILHFLLGKFSE